MANQELNDPRKREKPTYPYVEFAKEKIFNSHTSPTQEKIVVPVFINMTTMHSGPEQLASLRKEQKLKLMGYGNLDNPKFNTIRRILDAELNISPQMKEYQSAFQAKVEKEKQKVLPR